MNTVSSLKYLKANKIGITFDGTYPVGSTMLKFKLADESVNLYPYQKIKFQSTGGQDLTGNYNENYAGEKFIYLDTPTTQALSGSSSGWYFYFTSGQKDDNELMLKGDLIQNAKGGEELQFESQFKEFNDGSDLFNTNHVKAGTPHFIDGVNQYKLNRLLTKVYRRKTVQDTDFVSIGNTKLRYVDQENHPNYWKAYFEVRISKTNTFAKFLIDFDIYEDVDNNNSHFLVTNLYQDIPTKIYLQFNIITWNNSTTGETFKTIETRLKGTELGEVDIEFSVLSKLDMYVPAGFSSETNPPNILFLGKSEIEFYEGILGYNANHRFNLVLPGDTYTLPKQLEFGTNLNSVQTSGYYYYWDNETISDVNSILNYPNKETRRIFNLVVSNDSVGIYQELTTLNGTDLNSWRRYYLNGSWTEWYTFAKQKHTHKAADDIIEDSEHRFVTDAQIQSWNKAIEDLGNTFWLPPVTILTQPATVKGNVVYNLTDNHIYRYNGTTWLPVDIQALGIDGNINTNLNDARNNGFLVSPDVLNKIALGNLSKGFRTVGGGLAYIHGENNIQNYEIVEGSIDLVKRSENYNVSENVIIIGHNIINSSKNFVMNSLMIGSNIDSNNGIHYGFGLKNNLNNDVIIIGKYNDVLSDDTAFAIGFGTSDSYRKTIMFVDNNGYLNCTGLKLSNYDNTYVVLAGGSIQQLSYFGKQSDIDILYETKVDKSGTFLFELTADDDSMGFYNLLYDADSIIVETPNGQMLVNINGQGVTPEGIYLDPEYVDGACIKIPANISTTGVEKILLAPYNEEIDIYEPLNFENEYNHGSFTDYPIIVNFDSGILSYKSGTSVRFVTID